MIVNQANLHGLAVGYSTAYNKSFEATQSIIRRSPPRFRAPQASRIISGSDRCLE